MFVTIRQRALSKRPLNDKRLTERWRATKQAAENRQAAGVAKFKIPKPAKLKLKQSPLKTDQGRSRQLT
ncbi:hypothetical protein [uncultured Campylobacter sp.]|uniref:hypothetical protein n=1 Tax=uncultured Campylobacter sp. TaxID=218934 RepID=UPI002624A489|nr:hypothetical protein [uncultured Campylobacter sp.]